MADIKLATFNLYHFAAPGIFWHERKPTATYSELHWQEKKNWLSATIAAMDADVIGFQEVVSHEELGALMAENGYEHFFCTGHPIFDEDDPSVYVNATVAIASRFPLVSAHPLSGVAGVPDDTVIDADFNFSRTPVDAVIDLPGIGETRILVCHFKSQGAFVDDEDIDVLADWGDKIRTTYMQRAMADVNQVAKRAAEAGAIYRIFRQTLDADPDAPVILLGDLNESPGSHTISILTQADRVWSWGSVAANAVPEAFAYLKHVYKLYDSFNLVPMQGLVRPNTHGGIIAGSVLDYCVVSNGLNPKNPRRRGTVTKVEVFDDHFELGPPKARSSDHAPVVTTIAVADGPI
ncbi:endonuclease/exonuclease/phosphatase family protein [Hoeflea ulvae]|uniref:Endonuclease/exonuclease/phosphatase family protein n=1 Tax=Hoeflea ulvae TaxID=2983764 RepID=A0ABT3YJQ7_9HYPH|nr:endonuclease/exonuclease/phosphatase family protein [Hoeflea ulvae]MCY0096126.1 endonuclease/exonuclease/phosphatase family protein [Hoeflea ulvae]